MENIALEVKNVVKQVREKIIINDISFNVKKGEIFGLLGPNGSGKTTLIRMIAGLISKTIGKIIINGTDIDRNHAQAMMEIGIIVENPICINICLE
ncbi:ATP-binding cassette domain-containing protein [Bacillus methanolicus]|uniref:ATP-binding cassette domain-containing protein n=1 Tax=Bacillus methanolicus TaxID=1471 RepID=UPI000B18372F|nr:ATP-binding cassette domain-containing protein [Bacillus methanolicus]